MPIDPSNGAPTGASTTTPSAGTSRCTRRPTRAGAVSHEEVCSGLLLVGQVAPTSERWVGSRGSVDGEGCPGSGEVRLDQEAAEPADTGVVPVRHHLDQPARVVLNAPDGSSRPCDTIQSYTARKSSTPMGFLIRGHLPPAQHNLSRSCRWRRSYSFYVIECPQPVLWHRERATSPGVGLRRWCQDRPHPQHDDGVAIRGGAGPKHNDLVDRAGAPPAARLPRPAHRRRRCAWRWSAAR